MRIIKQALIGVTVFQIEILMSLVSLIPRPQGSTSIDVLQGIMLDIIGKFFPPGTFISIQEAVTARLKEKRHANLGTRRPANLGTRRIPLAVGNYLLCLFVAMRDREVVQRDMEELYLDCLKCNGRLRAALWYWSTIFGNIFACSFQRLRVIVIERLMFF